jgi:hypothetical protein
MKTFEYDLYFNSDEYMDTYNDLSKAIKVAKDCSKNLRDQGKTGAYSIFYDGIEIARF